MAGTTQEELSVYSARDIINMEFEENTAWWGDTLFDSGMKIILTGQPGTGKSLFAMNMIGALIKDEKFLGEVVHPIEHKVLYLDAELQLRHLKDRIIKISTERPLNHMNMMVISKRDPIMLDDKAHIDALIDFINENEYTMLVIDPLADFHTQDENNAGEMKSVCDNIDIIVEETGVGVLIIHHVPKGGYTPRGSTYLLGWTDLVMNLGEGQRMNGLDHVNLYFNKKRYVCIENKKGISRDGNMVYRWSEPLTVTQVIESALAENPEASNEELVEIAKKSGVNSKPDSIRKIRSRINVSASDVTT